MLSLGTIATKVFGSSNERKLKKFETAVAAINALEPEVSALSDEALRARTDEFRKRLADGETLDDLLPARWGNATLTCSSSAAWCFTKAASPK